MILLQMLDREKEVKDTNFDSDERRYDALVRNQYAASARDSLRIAIMLESLWTLMRGLTLSRSQNFPI